MRWLWRRVEGKSNGITVGAVMPVPAVIKWSKGWYAGERNEEGQATSEPAIALYAGSPTNVQRLA
jgi:hypothetical protein